jgi:hypothetical protein
MLTANITQFWQFLEDVNKDSNYIRIIHMSKRFRTIWIYF